MSKSLRKSNKPRIFIGTVEIAGYYLNLSKGLNILGIDHKYVQLSPNPLGFGSPSNLPFLIRLPYLLAKTRLRLRSHFIVNKIIFHFITFLFYVFEFILRTLIVLPWAVVNFDLFCFGCRSNIVGIKAGYWDIALLKLLGKKIIYIYHGSDGRPPYLSGKVLHKILQQQHWEKLLNKLTQKTHAAVYKVDMLADIIIDNPYSGHFHQKKFISWFAIGSPYHDHNPGTVGSTGGKEGFLRILHAPTHALSKGTSVIEACIASLKQEGFKIKLILLQNRPHHEVIDEIKKCDFVIDELYSDVLMAGFAAEAAFYAKPAIVCGYVQDPTIKEMIPTYYSRPEHLKAAIQKLITDSEFRDNLGKRAQNFVNKEWSYLKIAKCYEMIFANEIPQSWYINPKEITYLHGFGMPETLLKSCLKSFIKKCGVSALKIDDKPQLLALFLAFSNT